MLTFQELCEDVQSFIGDGYVYGTIGQMCTTSLIESKRIQYKDDINSPFHDGNSGYNYAERCKKWIGKKVRDCSGLVDGCLGVDNSAQGYYTKATVKGGIGTIPELPGILVFMKNSSGRIIHVGVYIGNGLVIESRGVDYGVVKTRLADRGWDYWAQCHLIDYGTGGTKVIIIKVGSTGSAVTTIQQQLSDLGYSIKVDGNFGTATEAVVRQFQTDRGFTADDCDGIVGDQTRAELEEAIAEKKAASTAQGQLATANARINELTQLNNALTSQATTYRKSIFQIKAIVDTIK